MAGETEGSITQFFGQLRAGDAAAVRKLWDHFFPRLLGLARQTLAGLPQRAADADDAVQSAFASFWKRVERGELNAPLDRDDLWNLLGLITVRKSLKQARRERAQKRGGGRVLNEDALDGRSGEPRRLDELVGQTPAHEFDLSCEELLRQLGDELRSFAVLRLAGYRNREIAERLNCTERKVERKLNLIRLKWEREWSAEE
jgi:RNA polymerase sigma factor (sigma-70 family)